jgi:AcrR family transcriptional regulator
MTDDVNSVKMTSSRSYHHGALREALIDAAVTLIEERGVEGFSLREAARRAGVSPAAPSHHFGDARGLLTAVAARTFAAFADALETADIRQDRVARIRSQAMAYARFALANRASFDLVWRKALIDDCDPDYCAAGQRAFATLDRAVRGDDAPTGGEFDASVAPSLAAWSIVHGFSRLAIDGVFGMGDAAAERAVEAILPAILDHLDV